VTSPRRRPLHAQLHDVSTLLTEHHGLWSPRPFREEVTWPLQFPAWAEWMLALDDNALDVAESDLRLAPTVPVDLRALQTAVDDACVLPSLAAQFSLPLPAQKRRVRGRKWQQIRHFLTALHPDLQVKTPLSVLDWCAGKAHLSRALRDARQEAFDAATDILAVDVDDVLLDDAAEAGAQTCCCDVLRGVPEAVAAGRHMLALHACGALSDVAIHTAIEEGADSLHVVGCCYYKHHLTYVPRSDAADAYGVDFTSGDLHLPVTDETVASPADKAHRRRAMEYRAGLDALLRTHLDKEGYTSTPAMPKTVFQDGFARFVRHMNERCGFQLPATAFGEGALDAALQDGCHHVARARRLGVVRGVFRRLVEVFIALDRALLLEEAGFNVDIGVFCSRDITPRNILLRAHR